MLGSNKKVITKDTIILQAKKILYMTRDGVSTYMDIEHLVMVFAINKERKKEISGRNEASDQ